MKKIALLLLPLLFFSCGKKQEKKEERQFPVKVAKAYQKDSILYIDTIGHVEALATIEVRSRVEGELIDIYFKEGDEVKKGDLLFQLDPRPFENQLQRSHAILEENLANLALAEEKVKRNEDLVKMQYISDLDYDQMLSNMERLQAVIKQNKVDIAEAKLNLDYTHIYAPIDGITGFLNVDRGNLIAPNSETALITVNQIKPIYVTFSIPENDLVQVKKYSNINPLIVRVSFNDLDHNYIDGALNLLDNTVDTSTGMIKLRGIYQNLDKALWPGQFIQTRLILTTIKNALLIPFQAVIVTSQGTQVYVVKDNNTVELRVVVLGQREAENVIVQKGVSLGETVVTEGQMNLLPGAKVTIETQNKEAQ